MSDEVEMGSLVTPSWLAEHLADPDLVVLDVRVTLTGHGPIGDRVGYRAGHIAGAVFADLPHELCDTDRPIAFAMPSPDAFCAAIGRLGVGELETRFADLPPGRIITYCGGGIAASAGAFAMLRAGAEDVAVYTA